MAAVPFLRIGGTFYRSVLADRIEHVLDPPGPQGAGRYHRPGQKALYFTAEADWAAIVTGNYATEDGLARVIIPLELDAAQVLDQRDVEACRALGIEPADPQWRWRPFLARGEEPPSWRQSDVARRAGADGITDPSRGIIDGWHVTLFRWNEPGAPQVRIAGDPLPFDYEASRARWAAPAGWRLGIGM